MPGVARNMPTIAVNMIKDTTRGLVSAQYWASALTRTVADSWVVCNFMGLYSLLAYPTCDTLSNRTRSLRILPGSASGR